MFWRRLGAVVLWVAASVAPACARDVAVISNQASGVSALTLPDLVKLCKAQTTRWPDGTPVLLVISEPGSPAMKTVAEKIYSMTPVQMQDLVATTNHGRKNRPAILVTHSDQEVIRRVESSPGALGLVDVYSITDAVKVVRIGGKLPLEPGYPLHSN